jgi:general nucleoside transport system ATP-binding protein
MSPIIALAPDPKSFDADRPATPVLALERISKRFGALQALTNVSLTVQSGEVHCLLGENGAGKSTLCNIIFGIHRPDAGDMTIGGRALRPSSPADALSAGVAMVHQHFSIIGNMTVVDNLMMGQVRGRLKRSAFAARIRELSDRYNLAVDPQRMVDDLSVGERQRVEVIKCLLRGPRLLVLDEPTAVLPPLEVDALLAICRTVADRGCGVMLVTHKLAEIAKIADRVTVLRAGRVVDAAPMKNADMARLVRSMIGRDLGSLGAVVAATLGAGQSPDTTEKRAGVARGREAMVADGVSFRDKQGVLRLNEITIAVGENEIVGLAGVEGNGQTELGAILSGLAAPTAGRLFVGGREVTGAGPKAITAAGAGIVPEDRHAAGCILEMSVAENLFLNSFEKFSFLGLTRRSVMGEAAAELMKTFDIRAPRPSSRMASLSGGNQQKAVLARELSLEPLAFLLAAQPTRGLDVGAVSAVYDRIRATRDAGVGVLLISSELDELIAVADRILVIYRGRIVGQRPGHPSAREAIGRLMAGESADLLPAEA